MTLKALVKFKERRKQKGFKPRYGLTLLEEVEKGLYDRPQIKPVKRFNVFWFWFLLAILSALYASYVALIALFKIKYTP